MTEYGVIDLLIRAEQLLRAPLPHKWSACEWDQGPYCYRCALARAKGDLDKKVRARCDEYDDTLMLAVAAVHGDSRPLSKADAIAAVRRAIERRRPS